MESGGESVPSSRNEDRLPSIRGTHKPVALNFKNARELPLKFTEVRNPGCIKKGASVLHTLPRRLSDPRPFSACFPFGDPSLEPPPMPLILWRRKEVKIFQTPNSCSRLSWVHSTATLRARSPLSARSSFPEAFSLESPSAVY